MRSASTADADPVRPDDEDLFVSRDLTSFVDRGDKVIPQIIQRGSGNTLPRRRRGDHLDSCGVAMGTIARRRNGARRWTR